jgi:hypothetical protein
MSSEDNFLIKNTSSLLCYLFKERDLVLKGKVKIDWKIKNNNNNI